MKFDYKNYSNILKKIISDRPIYSFQAYQNLSNDDKSKPLVILRHDVEVSPGRALKLAKLDNEEGAISTFFFLVTSCYNIFEKNNTKIINEILSMGHEVGLHYDGSIINDIDSKIKIFKSQIDLINNHFGIEIKSVSAHLPMRNNSIIKFPNYIDAYDKKFIQDMKYLSDSNQAFREPIITEQLHLHKQFQLLFHDNCWSEEGLNYELIMQYEACNRFKELTEEFYTLSRSMEQGIELRKSKDKEFQGLICK